MSKLNLVKKVTGFVVSIGVGTIVSNMIKDATPGKMGIVKKICVGVGAIVLSSMVSDKATKYVEDKIDETVGEVKNIKSELAN